MKKIIMGIFIAAAMTTLSAPAKKPAAKPVVKLTEAQKAAQKAAAERFEALPNYRAYLVGDEHGRVYYSENMHDVKPLASVTKIMTMLLTFEAIERGDVSLDDEVIISANAARQGGSMIPVKVGDKFLLRDLVKASGIHSANNATYAVAEHVGKGFDNFIVMMNNKAKELGLENEFEFHTPAGLPTRMTKKGMDKGSAYAIYKLSLEAAKHPQYMEIAKLKNPKIANDTIQLRSKNLLLGKEGIVGLKTGYHNDSLFNISVITDTNGVKTFYVVMGGKTQKIRDEKVLKLVKEFNESHQTKEVLHAEKSIVSVPVQKGMEKVADLYPDKTFNLVVGKNDDIRIETDRVGKIVAPIAKDTVLGTYTVYLNNKEVEKGDLLLKNDIEKKGFIDLIMEKL